MTSLQRGADSSLLRAPQAAWRRWIGALLLVWSGLAGAQVEVLPDGSLRSVHAAGMLLALTPSVSVPATDAALTQDTSAPSVPGAASVPAAPSATPRAARAPAGAAATTGVRIAAGETNLALRMVLALTVLAVLPALLVALTAFLRIIIVLSMLRHALGMMETPPNVALIGIALFLTLFTMAPTLQQVNQQAVQPFIEGQAAARPALEKGMAPLREFMVRQTREEDLALMVELSKAPPPASMADIGNVQLIPAFMLSELRSAFQIGFVIFLPFLLIDLIVSSVLMALGMMMMPPMTIALPLKILMFILVDGWALLLKALVGSFH